MKKKVLVLSAALALLLALPLDAQTRPADGNAPATREEVVRLLEVLRVKQQMATVREGMKAAMKSGAQDAIKAKHPDAKPEQIARILASVDEIFVAFPTDELIEAMVPIYQKYLTKSEVEATIAFYLSPTGQKLLDKLPQMTTEAMQAGASIAQRQAEGIQKRIEERIKELDPGPSPDKK